MSLTRILFLFLPLYLTSCQNGHPNSSLVKIVNGSVVPANDKVAQSTVALIGETVQGSTLYSYCTGTLIAEDLVLTAAHCIQNDESDVLIAFGHGVLPKEQVPQRLGRAVKNNEFVADSAGYGLSDIALIRLYRKAPSFMKAVPVGQANEFNAGTEVILAGYGLLGYNNTSPIRNEDRKLYKTVTKIESLVAERQSMIIYKSVNGLNSACSGDSGGPMYIADAEGNLKVIGVTRGPVLEDPESMRCSGRGTYTNAAFFLDWMKTAI